MASRSAEVGLPSSPSDLEDVIQQFAVASRSLSSASCQALGSLVEALKQASLESIGLALEACASEHILCQYSSDCTPAVIKKTQRASRGNTKINRSLQSSEEFLVQHMIWSSFQDGQQLFHRFYHVDPIALRHGKTMPALLACATEFPMIQSCPSGFSQIRIRHQVYDRGVSSGLISGLSGFWNSECTGSGPSESTMATEVADSPWEWHTQTFCVAHDCHNALKWGHFQAFGDTALMGNVWAGIAAYKFCSGYCIDQMHAWFGDVLVERNPDELPDPDTSSVLWTLLGAPADVLETLAHTRLVWQSGQQHVSKDFLETDDWMSVLSSCLVSLWQFESFSTSRWLSAGSSCRCMLRGLM